MNRPKYPKPSKDLSFEGFMCAESKYYRDIEKYCDELEQSNKSLSNAYDDCLVTLHFWEEEYHKCRKALNRACEILADEDEQYACCVVKILEAGDEYEIRLTSEEWKERLR